MSLQPPKRSDIGKSWMSKRRDSRKGILPEYHLIVTEGTKTEPNYFNAIKECVNRKYREHIHLEVFGEGDNTVNLFEQAKKHADDDPNGYRHIWIVYDTDDFPVENIDMVPTLCRKYSTSDRQFHAVWSNQCIELWFLLHFSYMHSNLHRSEYFSKLSHCMNGISAGDYSKNRDDIYNILASRTDEAVANAKRLAQLNEGKRPSASAPGTMVYELLEKLRPYIRT